MVRIDPSPCTKRDSQGPKAVLRLHTVWPIDVHGPVVPAERERGKTTGSHAGLHYFVVDCEGRATRPLFERIRVGGRIPV